MKTPKFFVVFIVITGIISLSACNSRSGHMGPKEPKVRAALTEKEALDTCFREIGEFEIVTNSSNKFSSERLEKLNCFYTHSSSHYLDSMSKKEETVYDYKRVHLCLIKANTPVWKLNKFVKNHGHGLTLQDMLALYEQNRLQIPPYIWILGGDFIDGIPAMYFLDNPEKKAEALVGQFIIFGTNPNDKDYKYKANYFAVVYWDSISAE